MGAKGRKGQHEATLFENRVTISVLLEGLAKIGIVRTRKTVWRWILKQGFPASKCGKEWMVPNVHETVRWIERTFNGHLSVPK